MTMNYVARISSVLNTCCTSFCGRISLAICLLLSNAIAQAQDSHSHEPQFDVYQLSASAEIEVPNDLMTVNLIAQATGTDAAELANSINASMGWAVLKLKPFTAIDSRTLDYQTQPQYERGGSRIKGWIASQSIRLETDNFEQAAKAIQVLQERLQVQGMHMSAKPETRKRAEDQLMNKALDAFKARALIVQTNMGAPAYRIMNLSINANGSGRHYPQADNYRGASAEMRVAEAPVIQAGTSQVTVHVNGQIRLE